MSQITPILVIGHVTRDLIGGEERLGGAAAYVSRALSARGMDVVLVTRAPDDPLLKPLATDPCIRLHLLPAESFTTFRHDCTWLGRTGAQYLLGARPIRASADPRENEGRTCRSEGAGSQGWTTADGSQQSANHPGQQAVLR